MMPDGRFKPGYDPRRNLRGGPGGPRKETIAQRREEDKAAKEREESIDKDTTMPLDYMLRTMRNPDLERSERPRAIQSHSVVTVTVVKAVPEQIEQPKLDHQGPKAGDKVQ
jgi:hypothetical protein